VVPAIGEEGIAEVKVIDWSFFVTVIVESWLVAARWFALVAFAAARVQVPAPCDDNTPVALMAQRPERTE
jgi:hypothetical protein